MSLGTLTLPRSYARPDPATERLPARAPALIRWSLALFVASVPFELPSAGLPLEFPTIVGFAFLATTLLAPHACYGRLPAPVVAFGIYLWALPVVAVLTGLTHHGLATRLAVNLAQLSMLLWVMANVLRDPRTLRATLLAFVIACSARAGIQLLGIGVTSHALWTGGERVTTFGQNANLSAIILSAGIVAAIGLRRLRDDIPGWLRVLAYPLVAVMATAVIQSGSRGGLLCAAVGLAVCLPSGATFTQRLRTGAITVVGLTLLVAGAWRSDMMRHRLEESAEQGHMAGREAIYPAAIDMFLERPLVGWGPIENQFEIAKRIRDPRLARRDAHNLLLELLTSTGLVGSIPFLVGLTFALLGAWRARHGALGILPLALLLTVLTGTLSGTWIASKIVWLALGVAVAAGGR